MIVQLMKKAKFKDPADLEATLSNWSYLHIHLSRDKPSQERLVELMLYEATHKRRVDIIYRLYTRLMTQVREKEWKEVCEAYKLLESPESKSSSSKKSKSLEG